ncbi:hypothetical protein D9M72_378150 [compost metagenome]
MTMIILQNKELLQPRASPQSGVPFLFLAGAVSNLPQLHQNGQTTNGITLKIKLIRNRRPAYQAAPMVTTLGCRMACLLRACLHASLNVLKGAGISPSCSISKNIPNRFSTSRKSLFLPARGLILALSQGRTTLIESQQPETIRVAATDRRRIERTIYREWWAIFMGQGS